MKTATAPKPAWRKVGEARDNSGNRYGVYQSTQKPQWFKARPGTEENPEFGFDGSFVGLADCVSGMGLTGFQLTI